MSAVEVSQAARSVSAGLRDATTAAARYLVAAADAAGGWSDYLLRVGPSDQWVTAHVAGALQLCSAAGLSPPGTDRALQAADAVLGQPDDVVRGWGFNRAVEPDADSTALAVLFLADRGRVLTPAAGFLARHRRPDGGYATFLTDDAWGDSHPCVTPTAALALLRIARLDDAAGVLRYVTRTRWADGTWPSYWWRACHYATYWNLTLLRAMGQAVEPRRPVVGGRETAEIRSVLDLACLVGTMHVVLGAAAAATREVAGVLLAQQRPDGGFDGGADLRVTRATCRRPWEQAEGDLYRDDHGLLTTAMALRVLTRLVGAGRAR
ncbi:MAG: hypothetical protein JWP95_1079 [Actinotalea sp.]|nr:hypothetical protein [Actinotalea sp.]